MTEKDIVNFIGWGEDAAEDQFKWASAKNPRLSENRELIDIFRAAFAMGWGKALKAAELHGFISREENTK
jgi:hypothetical protein